MATNGIRTGSLPSHETVYRQQHNVGEALRKDAGGRGDLRERRAGLVEASYSSSSRPL
jgi:hypothetical protein